MASRHPWRTLGAWLGAVVVGLALAVLFLPGNLTTEGHVTGNPEAKKAERLFDQRFPPDPRAVDELIAVRSPTRTVDQPAFTRFLGQLRRQADATGGVAHASALQVSRDRHAVL